MSHELVPRHTNMSCATSNLECANIKRNPCLDIFHTIMEVAGTRIYTYARNKRPAFYIGLFGYHIKNYSLFNNQD